MSALHPVLSMIDIHVSASATIDADAAQSTDGLIILLVDVNALTKCNAQPIDTLTLIHVVVNVILSLAFKVMFKINKLVSVSGTVKK